MKHGYLVLGYIGRGNAGDDAMVLSVIDALVACDHKAEVFVVRGQAPLKLNTGSEGLIRWVSRRVVPVIIALMRSDVVVWAGGSFLHDYGASLRYLRALTLTGSLVLMARLLRRRVLFLGVGIGPIETWWGRLLIRWVLRSSNLVVTRDEGSKALARELAPESLPVFQTIDLAFPALLARTANCHRSGAARRTRVGVSLLPVHGLYGLMNSDEELVEVVASAIKEASVELGSLEVVCLGFNWETDSDVSTRLASLLKEAGIPAMSFLYSGDPLALFQEIQRCDIMVSTRYHAAVFAYAARIPQVILAYHLKCIQFADDVRLESSCVLQPVAWTAHRIARQIVAVARVQRCNDQSALQARAQEVMRRMRDWMCVSRAPTLRNHRGPRGGPSERAVSTSESSRRELARGE